MSKQLEKPFEFLTKKDGSVFSSETYKNWYMAHAYVLDKLKDTAFVPNSDEYLHVVVTDVDETTQVFFGIDAAAEIAFD